MNAPYRIHGATGEWEVVIGLEVHAQVTSNAKLFSGASTEFGAEPNSQVSLVDAAMPGMLPVPNAECIRQAVRTGHALKAIINPVSRFDRKNYFYADLPQGYQISQLYEPIVGEGWIEIALENGATKCIGIERLHLEQDAGKLMHDQHPNYSYVDLNRCGVALMEIVSKADMRSPEEAGAYVRKLRAILRSVGSCNGNMEQGAMRADVNVSVRRPGEPLGTRTETKNVNSVRFIMSVVQLEARRQIDLLEEGGTVVQETRLFDPDRNETRSLRSKEDAHDYRYFPDPDLLPLRLTPGFIQECKDSVEELPDEKMLRYEQALGLPRYQAEELNAEVAWARFYDSLVEKSAELQKTTPDRVAKKAANLVLNEIFGYLKRLNLPGGVDPVSGEAVSLISANQGAELLLLLSDGTLSGPLYKEVFEEIAGTEQMPSAVVEAKGLKQTSDTGAIDAAIAGVLAANPDKVVEYRAGKDKLFGFFVGQVMKAMQGKANPGVVNELLRKALG